MKLSICIEMFWMDKPFEQRIALTQQAGYKAFEFWDWSNKDIDNVRSAQLGAGLSVAGCVCEPGFSLAIPHLSVGDHVEGVKASAEVAEKLDCSTLIVTTGNAVAGETYEMTRRRIVRKLSAMAAVAQDQGVTLVLEPLNPFVDHAGYWLTTMAETLDIVADVDSPSLKILYDIYHQQITEGNIIANLRAYAPWIGHIHVAGVPGRAELAGGELDYGAIFMAIEEVGYEGYVGLELRPRHGEDGALTEALSLLSRSR